MSEYTPAPWAVCTEPPNCDIPFTSATVFGLLQTLTTFTYQPS